MGKVRLLFASDGQDVGAQIALALEETGRPLSFGLRDAGDIDPTPVSATLVVWTEQARTSSDILLAADNARAEGSLAAIGRPDDTPDKFDDTPVVDLSEWTGDRDNVYWAKVLEEIRRIEHQRSPLTGQALRSTISSAISPSDLIAARSLDENGGSLSTEALDSLPIPTSRDLVLFDGNARAVECVDFDDATRSADRNGPLGLLDLVLTKLQGARLSLCKACARSKLRPSVFAGLVGATAALAVTGAAALVARIDETSQAGNLVAGGMSAKTVVTPWRDQTDPLPLMLFVEPIEPVSPPKDQDTDDRAAALGDYANKLASGEGDADADEFQTLAVVSPVPSDDVIGNLAWATSTSDADDAVRSIERTVVPNTPTVAARKLYAALPTSNASPGSAAPTLDASLSVLQDCEECPLMAAVPMGEFEIGSPLKEAARTREEYAAPTVSIGTRFSIGVHEVTFDEWEACVSDGGCRGYEPGDVDWGRGKRPVVNVSFEDAQSYVDWLSRKTGAVYRLPSEAEWEYAARGGVDGPFGFDGGLLTSKANYHGKYPYNGPKGVYRRQTLPVGTFKPNGFGLYDVHGNVWEWTSDCWRRGTLVEEPGQRPVDAGGDADCSKRVVKGGAWNTGGWRVRAAHREASPTDRRHYATGFRVVRETPAG